MGLQHQSLYGTGGEKIAELNGGAGEHAPIMGVGYYKDWTGWITGTSSISSRDIQDDLMIIAGSPNNFGFRNNIREELTLSGSLQDYWKLLSRDQ
jgi:hypothetical protein